MNTENPNLHIYRQLCKVMGGPMSETYRENEGIDGGLPSDFWKTVAREVIAVDRRLRIVLGIPSDEPWSTASIMGSKGHEIPLALSNDDFAVTADITVYDVPIGSLPHLMATVQVWHEDNLDGVYDGRTVARGETGTVTWTCPIEQGVFGPND